MTELLDRIRSGDQGAIGLFYAQLKQFHFAFLLADLRNRDAAEDAFEELFVLMLHVVIHCKVDNVWAYARGIRTNMLRKRWKESQRIVAIDEAQGLREPRQSPEGEASEAELRDVLRKAVEALPPHTKRLIDLCYFNDHSAEEIQRLLDLPSPQALRQQKSRAIAVLRERAARILQFPQKQPEAIAA